MLSGSSVRVVGALAQEKPATAWPGTCATASAELPGYAAASVTPSGHR
jgi:hypothetical protein